MLRATRTDPMESPRPGRLAAGRLTLTESTGAILAPRWRTLSPLLKITYTPQWKEDSCPNGMFIPSEAHAGNSFAQGLGGVSYPL